MRKILLVMIILLFGVGDGDSWSTTIKIATIAPEGSHWMQQMRIAANDIKHRTQGRVKLKFYGGGIMGNEKSVLRKIRIRQLQGAALTGSGLSKITADAMLYSLPLLTRSEDEMAYLRTKMDNLIQKSLLDSGFVSFGFAAGGFANLMSKTPISSAEDMKGLKVWVPEGDRASYAVMEALGLAPVTLPLSDVLTGLQTGLVDVVGSSPLGALAFQWYTQIHCITPLPLVYVYGSLVIDKHMFMRIKEQDRDVVTTVLEQLYRGFDKQNVVDDHAAMDTLTSEGLRTITPKPGELQHWDSIAGRVVSKMADDGVLSHDLYYRARNYLHQYRQQHVSLQ